MVPLPLLEVEEEECVCVPTALRDASTHRRHFTTDELSGRPSGAERPRSSHPRPNNASPTRALCMVQVHYPILYYSARARHNEATETR